MARNRKDGFVPLAEDDPAYVEAEVSESPADLEPEPVAPALKYIGPDYTGRIVLPHFTTPSDPRSWNDATIRSYLLKWPDLSRYFG